MKAMWNEAVIAEAPREALIKIEGNWYFPPESLMRHYFQPSTHHTTCIWKGEAFYFDVVVSGSVNKNGAWYYPEPLPDAVRRVKKDFTNYTAFWNGIEVIE